MELIMAKVINYVRKRFTQISNLIVVDPSISDGAYRVFSYVSTKPDDWLINNRDIQNKLNIKRAETIAKYWKELINSGWVSRQPIINANGKPSGYFDYVLNLEPIRPIPQNAEVVKTDLQKVGTPHKPHTVNQQLRTNRSYTNTESVSNTNIPTHTNNKLIVLNGAEWVRIAEKNKIVFSEAEKTAIQDFGDEFLRIRTQIKKSVNEKLILQELNKLYQYKVENYNIVLLIQDSISYERGFLFKTTPKYLIQSAHKSSCETKPSQRPHLFSNPKYIIPETPAEKKSLATWIQTCYKARINPKTNQPMSSDEIAIIDAHNKRFNAQEKDHRGLYMSYASWLDYILQNEVQAMKSLLDQPIEVKNDSSRLTNPTNLHIGDSL